MSKVKKVSIRASIRNVQARKSVKSAEPQVRVEIRELDPQRKCGAGTSVEVLYRVIEKIDGRATNHLVFFDRHGWYCEHGRACSAVAMARKHRRAR